MAQVCDKIKKKLVPLDLINKKITNRKVQNLKTKGLIFVVYGTILLYGNSFNQVSQKTSSYI